MRAAGRRSEPHRLPAEPVNRADGIARLESETFDVLVVGGGATGLGTAVDAAARGYRTALIEADDFAKATSSRSTKLVHGGVRYLQQGNVGLVREALRERANLLHNAPHLVHVLAFVVPAYGWFDRTYYGAGLKAYDMLAGRSVFARSRIVGAREARALVPALRGDGLRGAVVYADGQFDDARLAVSLARTAVDCGAAVANYVRATGFVYDGARVGGVEAVDRETARTITIRARAVVNATGIFVDELRALDDRTTAPLLTYSRGSHVVVRAEALGRAKAALLVPRTRDGRVLFATPWYGRIIIGTTDVPVSVPELEPSASRAEIAYIFETVNRYLEKPLGENDVLASFAGVRPLVNRRATTTAKQSREHVIDVSRSGVITVAGGKWTTYRAMGEDAVDAAARVAGLPQKRCPTARMPLHGAGVAFGENDDAAETMRPYGTDADAVTALARHDKTLRALLHARLPYSRAQVVYAARAEMARTVEDVLARRTRALVLDARAARECAGEVAALLARELGRDGAWEAEQIRVFDAVADRWMP
jgi:glycerol-3-phosphate dehydrogenase